MKTLNWIAWISAAAGIVIIILGTIQLLAGNNIFGVTHEVNFFHAANSLFLFTIMLFVFMIRNQTRKE